MRTPFYVVLLTALGTTGLAELRTASAVSLLKADFGHWDGDTLQPGFSLLAGDEIQATASGTFGSYTVDLTGEGFYKGDNSHLLGPTVRPLYRDYYYNNSTANGEGITLAIGGITPNVEYDLKLWSYDVDNVSPTPTVWIASGSSSGATGVITNVRVPIPTTLNDNSTTMHLTSTSDILDVFGTTTEGNGGTRLNAFQLVGPGNETLLSVDFGRPPSPPPPPVQPGFVGVTGLTFETTVKQTLGPYALTLSGGNGSVNTEGAADAIDPSVQALFRGFYKRTNASAGGSGVTVTIEGVQPNTDYDVTLWSFDADNFVDQPAIQWGAKAATTTSGLTGLTNNVGILPTSLADNRVTIRVHSTDTTLTLFGRPSAFVAGTTIGTRLNALQVDPALLGDANFDGIVNIFDINLVSAHWGEGGPVGDANGDMTVNIFDINLISSHWNEVRGGAATPVPEPSTLLLIVSGALCGAVVWRRGRFKTV